MRVFHVHHVTSNTTRGLGTVSIHRDDMVTERELANKIGVLSSVHPSLSEFGTFGPTGDRGLATRYRWTFATPDWTEVSEEGVTRSRHTDTVWAVEV